MTSPPRALSLVAKAHSPSLRVQLIAPPLRLQHPQQFVKLVFTFIRFDESTRRNTAA
jgi:hypothetical protein